MKIRQGLSIRALLTLNFVDCSLDRYADKVLKRSAGLRNYWGISHFATSALSFLFPGSDFEANVGPCRAHRKRRITRPQASSRVHLFGFHQRRFIGFRSIIPSQQRAAPRARNIMCSGCSRSGALLSIGRSRNAATLAWPRKVAARRKQLSSAVQLAGDFRATQPRVPAAWIFLELSVHVRQNSDSKTNTRT